MLAWRLSKSERTRRALQRVKAGNGPGEKGTIDVKGEYGRASSTVGGRKDRPLPLPLAVCQSPLGYAAMAAVDCLCAGGGEVGWSRAQAVRNDVRAAVAASGKAHLQHSDSHGFLSRAVTGGYCRKARRPEMQP
jgi:hypothetical protein